MNMPRYAVVVLLASLAALVSAGSTAQPGIRDRADLIFFNGRVLTMEPYRPKAQAVAIEGDTIVAVGGNLRVLALARPGTRFVNLRGKTLMPGFIDPHNHVFGAVFNGQHTDAWPPTYAEAQQLMLSLGITAIGDPFVWPAYIADFLPFAQSASLKLRTSLYPLYNTNCGVVLTQNWYQAYPSISDPRAIFRIPGIKFYTDGGSCGDWALSIPGDPDAPYQGNLYMTPEDLAVALGAAQAQGYQAVIHAAGDVAVDTALAGIESVLAGGPNYLRHRIEHNVVVREDQWPRYGEIGALPVLFAYGGACYFDNPPTPPDADAIARRPWFFPTRQILDANPGLPVAWHSDAGHNLDFPLAPLQNLWSLVTRAQLAADGSVCEPPEWLEAGAITIKQALRMATINSAYVLGIDRYVGSLRPGKFADLVVLSADPVSVPSAQIKDIDVLMTMVGGNVEHCVSGYEAICKSSSDSSEWPPWRR